MMGIRKFSSPGERFSCKFLYFELSDAFIFCYVCRFNLHSFGVRNNHLRLSGACVVALVGLWIDKGFLLVPAAFIPNVFGRIMEYPPSWVELTVSLGIYCLGMLLVTALYKVIIAVRGEGHLSCS